MRGLLLSLCLAHLRVDSWQLLPGCLSPLLPATEWVLCQVQVQSERYLEPAPLLRVAGGRGLAT